MGAVLPVMNQGSIGKSAYFATTDTISSIWYNKTGDLVPTLSIQQLNDCSKNYYDLYQFPYVIDAKGNSEHATLEIIVYEPYNMTHIICVPYFATESILLQCFFRN